MNISYITSCITRIVGIISDTVTGGSLKNSASNRSIFGTFANLLGTLSIADNGKERETDGILIIKHTNIFLKPSLKLTGWPSSVINSSDIMSIQQIGPKLFQRSRLRVATR